MAKVDKLIKRINVEGTVPSNMHFIEVQRVLEWYGRTCDNPTGSHYTFRKKGCNPITIPKHDPVKREYVRMVREVIREEEAKAEAEASGKEEDDILPNNVINVMELHEAYMRLPYELKIKADPEGGFIAWYPDLPGCLTCAETLAQVKKNAIDAKRVWIQAALEDGVHINLPK